VRQQQAEDKYHLALLLQLLPAQLLLLLLPLLLLLLPAAAALPLHGAVAQVVLPPLQHMRLVKVPAGGVALQLAIGA
jgi:hypothetical protein